MATETIQVPAPAMPAVAGRAATRGGSRARLPPPPPPRRGQIKEKILKDVVAAVSAMAAGLVKHSRGDGEVGLPASVDADDDK
uniref:Uncharacterized protein n=1 Tax=Zea mays TaxID=4577 RepID=B6SJT9_MAIZE|nr:hypothetical protein [Zea mays]ACG43988.1 hypothetical protein [Zea mays]